ncbi:MAG: T9SS type A sorting domain-containing protein [Flavobacteriales bacterium]|nr:T9SS type A sorting domain-containing protein [Flavobacteriales bacterium]
MISNKLLIVCALSTIMGSSHAQNLNYKNFTFDGNNREYAVYVPSSYDGVVAYPLLFNFHGGGDLIDSYMTNIDMRPIADTANFILVYPQAIPDPGNGGSTSWMHKEPTTHDDVPFVEAMIDSISADYNIDLNRVYTCGYSLGGEFSYELACQLNSEIAAIGAVARTMGAETFNNCSPIHPTGVITILGTADPISDYNGVWYFGVQYYMSADEQNDYWIDYNNCDTEPVISAIPDSSPSDGSTVERYTWSNADGCAYLEELKVIDGGHDWPGSFGNMDIDASGEIWNFVSRYDINGLINCSTMRTENGISESQKPFKVYPNPFDNYIEVETTLDGIHDFRLYDLRGKLWIAGDLTSDKNTIDLTLLPPNLYLLQVKNQTKRILKIE